jgi:hypothetical protein
MTKTTKPATSINYGIGQYRLACQYGCENGSRKLFQPHDEWPACVVAVSSRENAWLI